MQAARYDSFSCERFLQHRRRDGFSLIELSIMLMIVGVVMAVTISWLSPSAVEEAQKLETTRDRLRAIERAFEAFRVYQGRLPCPADRLLTVTDEELGQEDCESIGGGVNIGAIPTRTLGVDGTLMEDGWGRRFTYAVSTAICGVGSVVPLNAPLNCSSANYANGAAGDLTARTTDPGDTASSIDITAAAVYVVISHGANGDGGYLPSGSQYVTGAATPKEQENTDDDTVFWVDGYHAGYDDLAIYANKDQLEYATMDYDDKLLTQDECENEISAALTAMGSGVWTTSDEIDDLDNDPSGLGGVDAPSEEMMRVLWYTQEVCTAYYPGYYGTTSNIKCPGKREFSAVDDYCKCVTLPTWSDADDECS